MPDRVIPKFSRKDSKEFFQTLNKRVNKYFKDHKISKTGNWRLYTKTIVMFSLLFAVGVCCLLLACMFGGFHFLSLRVEPGEAVIVVGVGGGRSVVVGRV